MTNLYGTVSGDRRDVGTGAKNEITVAAQSANGSVITSLYYQNDTLMCRLSTQPVSKSWGGEILYDGAFSELANAFHRA